MLGATPSLRRPAAVCHPSHQIRVLRHACRRLVFNSMEGERMRSSRRRVVAGAIAGLACTAMLTFVPVAIASWASQYAATRALSVRNCYRLQFTHGHGACTGVAYRSSGPFNTAAPGSRYFRWYIRFTGDKCPAIYHINAGSHIFYANFDGRCF
jgi:hypothetical protein